MSAWTAAPPRTTAFSPWPDPQLAFPSAPEQACRVDNRASAPLKSSRLFAAADLTFVIFASRRLIHRPVARLLVLGVLAVWLASSFSFVCTRPLVHKASMGAAECPLAAHHDDAGHGMPADDGCAGQPCLDEIQSVDLSWSKPDGAPVLAVFALLWVWRLVLQVCPMRGPPRRGPPDCFSIPLFQLFCVLRN